MHAALIDHSGAIAIAAILTLVALTITAVILAYRAISDDPAVYPDAMTNHIYRCLAELPTATPRQRLAMWKGLARACRNPHLSAPECILVHQMARDFIHQSQSAEERDAIAQVAIQSNALLRPTPHT
ncbi:hypothetical protein [uncultured Corynebacterium sp.]|uniref:hypothetical protein n=1 Tax=uncultured Corynebacterium sp. TaxID=159447 RepID=UPI00288BB7B8|nr:hypothetical protein [uncultured Corynebacterium sp.]